MIPRYELTAIDYTPRDITSCDGSLEAKSSARRRFQDSLTFSCQVSKDRRTLWKLHQECVQAEEKHEPVKASNNLLHSFWSWAIVNFNLQ